VDLTPDKMIIHVLDEGTGFKLSEVADPLAEENLLSHVGPRNFLMRAFMDEFDVVPGKTGGAEIVMSKKLPSPGSSPMATVAKAPHRTREHKGIKMALHATIATLEKLLLWT